MEEYAERTEEVTRALAPKQPCEVAEESDIAAENGTKHLAKKFDPLFYKVACDSSRKGGAKGAGGWLWMLLGREIGLHKYVRRWRDSGGKEMSRSPQGSFQLL